MQTNIYLFFPETEAQILNDTTSTIIDTFYKISNKVKEKSDIRFYYDEENIQSFIELNKLAEIYLEKDANQLRFKLSKINSTNIKSNLYNLIDNESLYLQWNLDAFEANYCSNILKDIYERKTRNRENHILINFNNSIKFCRERLLLFKDSRKEKNLPKEFVHVDFVSDFEDFEVWLKTSHISEFTLLNKSIFKRTSSKVKGAMVYEDLNTGYYWHLDTLHSYIEYEVYNNQKEHIGTANEKGELNKDNKVEGRSF